MNIKDIKLYLIQEKKTKEIWIANSKKYLWFRSADAQQAYNSTTKLYFRNQDKLEIIEFELKEVDQNKKMTNQAFRKKLGLK